MTRESVTDKTRPEALGGRLEGSSTVAWGSDPRVSIDATCRRVRAPFYCQPQGSRHTPLCRPPGYEVHFIEYCGRHMECACYYEPSPLEIGGQSSMAVTKASPETSSSGRFSGNMRPAHRPLSNIHERGRMISASTIHAPLPSRFR